MKQQKQQNKKNDLFVFVSQRYFPRIKTRNTSYKPPHKRPFSTATQIIGTIFKTEGESPKRQKQPRRDNRTVVGRRFWGFGFFGLKYFVGKSGEYPHSLPTVFSFFFFFFFLLSWFFLFVCCFSDRKPHQKFFCLFSLLSSTSCFHGFKIKRDRRRKNITTSVGDQYIFFQSDPNTRITERNKNE